MKVTLHLQPTSRAHRRHATGDSHEDQRDVAHAPCDGFAAISLCRPDPERERQTLGRTAARQPMSNTPTRASPTPTGKFGTRVTSAAINCRARLCPTSGWAARSGAFAGLPKTTATGALIPQQPTLEIRRQGETTSLIVRLVTKPVTLTRPRTITFGLMATPAKPMPETPVSFRRWWPGLPKPKTANVVNWSFLGACYYWGGAARARLLSGLQELQHLRRVCCAYARAVRLIRSSSTSGWRNSVRKTCGWYKLSGRMQAGFGDVSCPLQLVVPTLYQPRLASPTRTGADALRYSLH